MTKVTILHEAEMELLEAVAFYEHKAAGLGLSFLAVIERSIQIIRKSPRQWPLREDGTRRYLTHRFPFLIIYTCRNDHVWVIAFAHSKRSPGYWSDRT